MPIFNSDQMIEGSSKEIPAKILNLISNVLRMRVVIEDILETSEKSETGKLQMDHYGRLSTASYGDEFFKYAEDLAEYYLEDFSKEQYKYYISLAKSWVDRFFEKENKWQDSSQELRSITAVLSVLYFQPGGGRDNLTSHYLWCVMDIFNMAKGTVPDLSRDMNSMWEDLNNTAKTNLQGTTLMQLLLNHDYDSAYKTLWKLANSGNENKKEPFSFQIGANASNALQLQINIPVGLWSSPSFTLTSSKGAERAIQQADQFMGHITTLRSEIGAYQNRLESALANAEQSAESLQDAESRMRDANMEKETADYLKTKLQNEFQQSFLAQKNASSMDLSVLSFPEGK